MEPRYSVEQINFIIEELTRVTKPGGYVEVSGVLILIDMKDLNMKIYILTLK